MHREPTRVDFVVDLVDEHVFALLAILGLEEKSSSRRWDKWKRALKHEEHAAGRSDDRHLSLRVEVHVASTHNGRELLLPGTTRKREHGGRE